MKAAAEASQWHLLDLAEEAWRRIRPLDVIASVVLAVLAAGIVAVNALDLERAGDAVRAQNEAGTTIFEVTALPDEDGVQALDSFGCAAIANSPSVLMAGASRGEDVTLNAIWQPSGLRIRTMDLTRQALQVWWPDAPTVGQVFAGADLSERTGIGLGSAITLNGQTATVAGVLPASVRPAEWRAALVRIVPPSEDGSWSCWMRLKPAAVGLAEQIGNAAYPTVMTLTAVYAKTDELSRSPLTVLREGAGRWIWPTALGIGIVLSIVLGLTARHEAAVYRATGSRYRDLWAMAVVRSVILTAAPAALTATAAAAIMVLTTSGLADWTSLWYAIQPACLYLTAMVAVTPAVTTGCAIGPVATALSS